MIKWYKQCEALPLPEGFDVHRGIRMCYDHNIGNSKGDAIQYNVIVECNHLKTNNLEKNFYSDTLDKALIKAYRYIESNIKIVK